MINTFYGLGTLDSIGAIVVALIIGFFFGLALERAGFGSSRRLAGIFYFTDMTVLKVMFTALISAMLGLALFERLGILDPATQIYYMPTFYGTSIVAGLIFGAGFVIGGWCPGTAAVGLASGKLDALFFLVGGVIGSIIFNELYPVIKALAAWGQSGQSSFGQAGLAFVYDNLGISKQGFALIFTLVAVVSFWVAEYIEQRRLDPDEKRGFFNQPVLKALSAGLIMFAFVLLLAPSPVAHQQTQIAGRTARLSSETVESAKTYLSAIEDAEDHVDPELLAEHLYGKDPGVIAVDVRPSNEYSVFHIRGAVNVLLPDLPEFAGGHKDKRMIVLYSNGMTHPAQARDQLYRLGYRNVYILTDGLSGFLEHCLKPVSLRNSPVSEEVSRQIRAWRSYFLNTSSGVTAVQETPVDDAMKLLGLIDTGWLSRNLGRSDLKIIDCRDQPAYNTSHIPGSMAISSESFRGVVDGLPSMLLPAGLLAAKISLMNIAREDTVVLVYGGDRIRDATLIAMVFERLGHTRYGILEGGFEKWNEEKRPITTDLPPAMRSDYTPPSGTDDFTVDSLRVLHHVRKKDAVILDVRPSDYFSGKKSDEARAGHIPGAINRDFKNDLLTNGTYTVFKPLRELETVYAGMGLSKDRQVVVHCRTGHQASQTYFVLKRLLGYRQLFWYDAGWTEWAARKELPIETGPM